MSTNKKIAEFPDVEAKLQKPTKQSAFERQRAEAEAKRRREAAETAAVYEDFIKSFDHDADEQSAHESRATHSRVGGGAPDRPAFGGQPSFGGGAGKRHFGAPTGPSLKSGPGSLGPALPPPLNKRRAFDGFASSDRRDREETRGRLGFDDRDVGPKPVSKVFDASDEEEEESKVSGRAEEKAISKPTLRLVNLPPNFSPAAIKALIPSSLTVENVKILPPSGPGGTDRKSTTAIVTLSKETPATEIDAAVSVLQNRYLGFGFYLSLHRHLSSAAISSVTLATAASSTTNSQPFGAKKVTEPGGNLGAPSTGFGRSFAPPSSYGPPLGGPMNRGGILHVSIQPPKDIKKLRMIHKVLESVLEHGLEFEALLMSRPEVQREEKWAWIWDARSEGGIWYRWRLWQLITGSKTGKGQAKYFPLFEGSHAWKAPDQALPYEYATGVDEFVSDSDYNSSDDEDMEDEQNRQAEIGGPGNDQEDLLLNPIEKAKLAHLLARLPKTLSKIRKGDIARITAFAITHASRGADEVAGMIVSNVERPFAYMSANPDHKPEVNEKGDVDDESRDDTPAADDKDNSDPQDTSAASLIGLYVASDILSCSSTSGIRHAWRYRQLFEACLRNNKTFEKLGTMADKHGWGRLRAEKWKRSVKLVLSLWEGWCVFPIETHEAFVSSFENPSQSKKAIPVEDKDKKDGRWKAIDTAAAHDEGRSSRPAATDQETSIRDSEMLVQGADHEAGSVDVDGDVDSWAYVEYSEPEVLSEEEDIDGETLVDLEGLKLSDQDTTMGCTDEMRKDQANPDSAQVLAGKAAPSRKRMRAVDMFADSGSEDGG